MPAMKFAAVAALAGSVSALPHYSNTTTYACNPAHSYPGGAQCISTAGSLTLVTPGPTGTAAATTFACNPAHSYPGASCISTAGTLSLVKNNATATRAADYTSYVTEVVTALTTYCPESTQLTHNGVTYTVSSATTLTITDCPCTLTHTSIVPGTISAPTAAPTYACNPAHSYPGSVCVSTAGTLSLVPGTYTPAVSTPASAMPTYACNPAHSYPGSVCVSTAGTLSLVPGTYTPAISTPASAMPTYACNPAHSYPGQVCISTAGTLSLVPGTYTPSAAGPTATGPAPAVSTAVVPPPAQSTPAGCPAPVTVTVTQVQATTVTATVTVNTCAAAATTPAPVSSAPATTYACNPAHSYPNGAKCVSSGTGLTLVTPAPVSSAPATTYACNPAHSYPNGAQCVSSGTGLTLVTPTPMATPSGFVCSTMSSGVMCSPVATPAASTSTKAITTTVASTLTSVKASSSSAPVISSAASTIVPSTTASSTISLNSAGATACPLNLPTEYQYPHLIEVNGVNGYFGQVDKNTNTTFKFDVPNTPAYAGKTCNTYFAIPAKSKLVTTDYTLSLADGAKIFVESDNKTMSFTPNPVDKKWLVKSEQCQVGKAVEFDMYASASLSFRWFNDYNPCALGLFMIPE